MSDGTDIVEDTIDRIARLETKYAQDPLKRHPVAGRKAAACELDAADRVADINRETSRVLTARTGVYACYGDAAKAFCKLHVAVVAARLALTEWEDALSEFVDEFEGQSE